MSNDKNAPATLSLTNIAKNIESQVLSSEEAVRSDALDNAKIVAKHTVDNSKIVTQGISNMFEQLVESQDPLHKLTQNLIGHVVKQIEELDITTSKKIDTLTQLVRDHELAQMQNMVTIQKLLTKLVDTMVSLDAKTQNLINPPDLNS